MSTSSSWYTDCFCASDSQHAQIIPPSQLNQKQVTLSQVISYKKSLGSHLKPQLSPRNKISISGLKKSKEMGQNANHIIPYSEINSQKNKHLNIEVANQNNYQYNHQDYPQYFIPQNLRVQQKICRPQEAAFINALGNKIINRIPSNIQNKTSIIPYKNNESIKKISIIELSPQLKVNIRMDKPQKAKSHLQQQLLLSKTSHRYIRSCSQNADFQAKLVFKSAQQTVSTNPSHDVVWIKQTESLSGLQQSSAIIDSICENHEAFPDGFRKAQSLQNNELQMSDLSIVLDRYSIDNEPQQSHTDRMIKIRDMEEVLNKKYESEKRENIYRNL